MSKPVTVKISKINWINNNKKWRLLEFESISCVHSAKPWLKLQRFFKDRAQMTKLFIALVSAGVTSSCPMAFLNSDTRKELGPSLCFWFEQRNQPPKSTHCSLVPGVRCRDKSILSAQQPEAAPVVREKQKSLVESFRSASWTLDLCCACTGEAVFD